MGFSAFDNFGSAHLRPYVAPPLTITVFCVPPSPPPYDPLQMFVQRRFDPDRNRQPNNLCDFFPAFLFPRSRPRNSHLGLGFFGSQIDDVYIQSMWIVSHAPPFLVRISSSRGLSKPPSIPGEVEPYPYPVWLAHVSGEPFPP